MRHSGKKLTSSFAWKERLSASGKNYGSIGRFYRWLTVSCSQYTYF